MDFLTLIQSGGISDDLTEIGNWIDNGRCASLSNGHQITVHAPSGIIIFPQVDLCVDANPAQLFAAPFGGSWAGNGVSPQGLFDPSVAGIGVHELTYSYSDGFGCIGSAQLNLQVNELPEITIEAVPELCWADESYILEAQPLGGIWSGDVNENGVFDQAQGVGTYFATYTWINPNTGCEAAETISWNVTYCCNADAGDLCPVSLSHETVELCEGQEYGGYIFTYAYNGTPPNFGDYNYAFLLVDQTGDIVQVKFGNGDFDFAIVEPGMYSVYGLSYSENINTVQLADFMATVDHISEIEGALEDGICADLTTQLPGGQEAQVIIYDSPDIEILAPLTIDVSQMPIQLNGLPQMGSNPNDNSWWSGDSISSNGIFASNQLGFHTINYYYFTEQGCGGTASTIIEVIDTSDQTPPTLEYNIENTSYPCAANDMEVLELYVEDLLSPSEAEDVEAYILNLFDMMLLTPNASDNSGIADLLIDLIDVQMDGLDCPEVARISIQYSAIDGAGNVSQSSLSPYLSILDNDAPVFFGIQAIINANSVSEIPTASGPEIVADCNEFNLSHFDEISSQECGFIIERNYLATDFCGNSSSFIQTINVIDYDAPVNLNQECQQNGDEIMLSWEPYQGSVACQLRGGLLDGNDPANIVLQSSVINTYQVSLNDLEIGQTYQWRVRCGCDLDPIVASPWSEYMYFTPEELCNSASLLQTEGENGVKQLAQQNEMELFPNPAIESVSLLLHSTSISNGVLILRDVMGRLVYQEPIALFEGPNRFEIDLTPYQNGTYQIEFMDIEGARISSRLMIID